MPVNPSVVKRTINAGRGKVPDYRDGTKAVFHYEVLKPLEPVAGGPMPESRESYTTIDDSRKSWPHGYGKALELIFGKKFQLPVFETMLRSMLVDEISQFDVEKHELVTFPIVSKKLRDIVKPDDCGHGHSHGHSTHMCAASMSQGTGYPELDEYMKSPTPLRFVIHLLSVTQPEDYEAESWQLTSEQKLESVEKLRLEGNEYYSQKKIELADTKYREAITRLDTLLLREKPGEPEWDELDKKNIALYSNVCQCCLLLGRFYDAREAASEVLKRDPENQKALFRRAKAEIGAWLLDEADDDLDLLLKLHPSMEPLVQTEKALIAQKRREKKQGDKKTSKQMCKAFGDCN